MHARKNENGFSVIEIILVILVIGLIGVVGWLVMKAQNTSNQSAQNNTEMTATNLTNKISGSPTVVVTHPTGWQVTEDSNTEDGTVSASKTITSSKGNSLELSYSDLGVGGSCESDNQEFTLTKKLSTATTNVYFTEYSIEATASEPARVSGLKIDTSTFDVASKEVGAKGTNVCDTKIGYYSRVGGNGAENSVTVKIKSPKSVDAQNVLFADIANDTDFIAMLQSLKVTIN